MTTSRWRGGAAAVLGAALLLTSCGDSGDEGTDEIVGAERDPTEQSSTPASEEPARDAPEFDFPADLKVEVDADTTGDGTKDAVLRDHGYAVRANMLALAKLDPKLPVLAEYVAGDAFINSADNVESFKADARTVTGATRFYDREVELREKGLASVTYCEDQRKAFNKDVDSGEVDRTEPSDESFVGYTALMEKTDEGVWQMTFDQSERGAPQCQL
ncbi:hypothetical protein [Streptomyces sp. CMB-StM0423]|uniref:hypothetical protein n=1 Tax=Streptomyces sp. CMB-StM0423 TaxID=2059884 RepID=UPI000C7136C6|nr:hypothetical protein [Streptomyces sp. CMB-StM0423]AUH39867.1 hypothetical protein CXR04_06055 [Streptomyces sp. CMB-StM0423]